MGDAAATLGAALRRLREALGPLRIAPLYRTAAVPASSQPPFLNTAAVGTVPPRGSGAGIGPAEILALGKALERAAGRRRTDPRSPRYGPRPLDVDLALYGSRVAEAPELTLPHPRLAERRFMLEPLAAVAPDLPVPPDGRTVAELLAALDDRSRVERLDRPGWPPAA